MITIKDEHYIAEGKARVCYYHPDDNNLCIKIGKPEVEIEHLYKEIKYFHKIRNKDVSKFSYPFYANYLGEVETNKGVGFVYELVKDEDTQKISLTLRHYLEMENSPISDAMFLKALERLKNQMIKHKIFMSDHRARNLCCKILNDNSIELIIIDGIGHRDFFPFADYFNYFAKKKVERRFIKLTIDSLNEQRELFKDLRAKGETII